MKIPVKKNGVYLIQIRYTSSESSIHKIKIEEVTETCYLVYFCDTKRRSWERKSKFKASEYCSSADYEIIEELTELTELQNNINYTNANKNY